MNIYLSMKWAKFCFNQPFLRTEPDIFSTRLTLPSTSKLEQILKNSD